MMNWAKQMLNKKKNANKLAFLKAEGEMVRRALEEQAAGKAISGEAKEILSVEEINALLQTMSPSGHVYKVDYEGALDMYKSINLGNYRQLVNGLGHLDKDDEFLFAMCLIDKCEEYADYESMGKAFRIFEYVIRHNKTNAPVVTYAREFNIHMRRYLEELNLL